MKYIIKFIGMFLCLIFLTACSEKKNTENNINNNEICEENNIKSNEICEENKLVNLTSNVTEGESGYYFLKCDFNGYYITYISEKSNNMIYLCGKPECNHVDERGKIIETCNAYVGQVMPESIKFYDDNIYLLTHDIGTYDVSLTRISKDGSKHEQLFVVGSAPEQVSGIFEYVISDGYAYVIASPEEIKADSIAEFSRWNLESGNKKVIYQNKEEYYSELKLYDGYVYYQKYNKSEDAMYCSICRYDIAGKKEQELVSDNMIGYVINNNSNSLLYWANGQGLKEYNIDKRETKLIKQSDETNVYTWIGFNGEYIYIDNYPNALYSEENKNTLEVLSINGNTVSIFDLSEKKLDVEYCGEDYIIAMRFGDYGEEYVYIDNDDIKNTTEWKVFDNQYNPDFYGVHSY